MPFINATQVRVGMIINYEGELCRVTYVEHQTPGNLPARIQTRMKRLKDGINRENRFGSADKLWLSVSWRKVINFINEPINQDVPICQ